LSCIGLVYGLYNLKQLRTAQKIEYEIDGATLSTLPYKSLDAIHAQKLNIPNQCKNTNGKEEEIIQCLKSLESDVFYYKKDITNIDYDPNSQLLKFDCNFTTSSTSNNLVEIKVDDYDSKGYRPLDIQIFKVIPADEIDSFQNRLIQHGQCSYLLSGIKDVYVENNNNISSKVVVPVKLDVYIWFNDDLSIFYHEQTNNYSIYDY
jgi:hypothetical protein